MTESERTSARDRARELSGRGEWDAAYQVFRKAIESGAGSRADFPFLAELAYAAGRLDVTIATWERAHAEALRAGDHAGAAGAAVRVALHLVLDVGLMAPVRGWIKRAERLLAEGEREDTPAHAWLAVVRNYERMLSGDFEEARRWARRAAEVGATCDPAAAAVGRVAEARNLIFAGRVAEGLSLLDESAVSAVSGELEPLPSGVVYCEVVCALQSLAQYDLAEEWTTAMEAWRHGRPVGSVHGRCRVHRAEILRLRGHLGDAEGEAIRACEELRPFVGREMGWPLTELGRIRLRTGDLEGAREALQAAHEVGWDPNPWLALVQLAQGEGPAAVRSIRDALEQPLDVPSKEMPPNTELRRAPLLAAQVEIEIAAGDPASARSAADELADIAASFQSAALEASAVLAGARVRLAEGDAEGARDAFGDAVRRWSEIGAPYEVAQARVDLARAQRALGSERQAVLELEAARSGFERIGAIRDAKRIQTPRGPSGVGGGGRGASEDVERVTGGAGVLRKEGDHWLAVFGGRSARIADLKGLGYIARLLANPGRELHACDLVAGQTEGNDGEAGARFLEQGGFLLDAEAKQVYRRRLDEIEEDIDEARLLGDHARLEQAEMERDFLVRELSRAVGLGGRDRRSGTAAERARVSVTRAIRRAIERIRQHHPTLGEHLETFVRTGTYCAYTPDPRVRQRWST